MINPKDEIRIINHNGQIITTKLTDDIETINFEGHLVTTKPTDAITAHLGTSCNKDVAIAMLLGLLKGPRFPKTMIVNLRGVSLDLLYVLQDIGDPLQELLSHWRNVASQEYAAAKEAKVTPEVLKEKEEATTNAVSLYEKAFIYMMDIDEELEKGNASAIKIDPQKTEEKGTTHITLRSFDRWAKKKYVISILENKGQHASTESIRAQPITQDTEEDLDTKDGLKRKAAESFLTTFAFLVEAFHKIALEDKSIKFGEDKPNIKAISEYIEELARIANNGELLDDQKFSSIKLRINRARDLKKLKLPEG